MHHPSPIRHFTDLRVTPCTTNATRTYPHTPSARTAYISAGFKSHITHLLLLNGFVAEAQGDSGSLLLDGAFVSEWFVPAFSHTILQLVDLKAVVAQTEQESKRASSAPLKKPRVGVGVRHTPEPTNRGVQVGTHAHAHVQGAD